MSKINEPDNGTLWYLLGRTVVAVMEGDVRDIGNFTDGTNRAQLFNGRKKKKNILPNKGKGLEKIFQMSMTASILPSIFNDCARWGQVYSNWTINKNASDLKVLSVI